MGYTQIKHRCGEYTNYWPDNTHNTIYIEAGYKLTMSDLMDHIKTAWPGQLDYDDIEISSEYIHTQCLYYDQYDSSDYTNFIVITNTKV